VALGKATLGPDHPDTLGSLGNLAAVLVKLDRGAEAVPLIDDCVRRAAGKFVDPGLIPRLMNFRLRHYEKAKDATGCRATAEMWENLKRTDSASLFDAACMRAVTTTILRAGNLSAAAADDAAAEADRAMAWLKLALAAGYKDAAHLKKDKDLDVLRERPDFRKLLVELEATQK
jgi:hypothetical protein